MANRPKVETAITQHTLWQALTGTPPPPTLAPRPISSAVLDSRDVEAASLFIAFSGARTDGHKFIRQAIAGGADAVICEERGLEQLHETGALLVDCRRHLSPLHSAGASLRYAKPSGVECSGAEWSGAGERPVAYIVPHANTALQAAGVFQRLHRTCPDLRVVGVTGSVGKTSTKELTASVLAQRYRTHHNTGNLNSEQGLPLALLGLHTAHERTVLEMGMYDIGEIRLLCDLARPHIGVVTNVGPTHLERLGTIDRIAQAKTELVEALPNAPSGGAAILNQDDARVRAMAAATAARPFFYGLTPQADLWADEIESLGMDGIRFRLHHRQTSLPHGKISNTGGPQRLPHGKASNIVSQRLKVPLLGRHSVYTALGAAAVGIVSGLSWQEIGAGLQQAPSQLRLVVMPGINGSTVIDDTYNASPVSTVAALNLLNDLFTRRQSGEAQNPAAPAAPDALPCGKRSDSPRERRSEDGCAFNKALAHAVSRQHHRRGRRIAILGDMRELGTFTTEGHKQVGAHAAGVTDLLVTVGALGGLIADQARKAGLPSQDVYEAGDFETAVQILKEMAQPQDLLLVKGSRAVGMERIVPEISQQPKTDPRRSAK